MSKGEDSFAGDYLGMICGPYHRAFRLYAKGFDNGSLETACSGSELEKLLSADQNMMNLYRTLTSIYIYIYIETAQSESISIFTSIPIPTYLYPLPRSPLKGT